MQCSVWLSATLNGLLDSKTSSQGRVIWAPSPVGGGRLLLAVTMASTQRCWISPGNMAFISGKTLFSALMPAVNCRRPRCFRLYTALYSVMTSFPATSSTHRSLSFGPLLYGALFSIWLGGKGCTFLETSHWISGFCWAGLAVSMLFMLGKLGSACQSLGVIREPNR